MSLYQPVKYALMIILLIGLIVTISRLVPEMQKQRGSNGDVIELCIALLAILVGLFGAYRDNRQLLLLFAIGLFALMIWSIVHSQQIVVVGHAILDIVSICLAVYQSEMIRSGDL